MPYQVKFDGVPESEIKCLVDFFDLEPGEIKKVVKRSKTPLLAITADHQEILDEEMIEAGFKLMKIFVNPKHETELKLWLRKSI
jgi:hypothetical protein